jgi:glycerol-3-phosphate acyltransferase PlsY
MQIFPLDLKCIAALIVAYLLGSVSSAILLCRWLNLPDPRERGSNNPGATNVLRIAGKPLAATVLVLDALKGWLAVSLASLLSTGNFFIASIGVAVFLGQLFPVFFNFRGGKGIAVTLGVILAWHWPLALLCLFAWLTTFIIYRISGLAGIAATLTVTTMSVWALTHGNLLALNLGELPQEFSIAILILAAFVSYKHKDNVKRLINNADNISL